MINFPFRHKHEQAPEQPAPDVMPGSVPPEQQQPATYQQAPSFNEVSAGLTAEPVGDVAQTPTVPAQVNYTEATTTVALPETPTITSSTTGGLEQSLPQKPVPGRVTIPIADGATHEGVPTALAPSPIMDAAQTPEPLSTHVESQEPPYSNPAAVTPNVGATVEPHPLAATPPQPTDILPPPAA